MTYQLILGDRAYSSWSLRGWLLFHRFGLEADTHYISFADGPVAGQLAGVGTATTVPTMLTPDGATVSESLAIAEELASRHPAAGIWPADPAARATARTLAAEMHAGFDALRTDCPMNLRRAYTGFSPSPEVSKDLRRLETLWDQARATCAPAGPWLCGDYCAADAFFAPIVARIAGYGLLVSDSAQAYVDAHLIDPAFRRWRAMSLAAGPDLPRYAREYDQGDWPGPQPLKASATDADQAENERCPYSQKRVTHFLDLDGRVFGFCNSFCRDKTLADPAAWPQFMALVDRDRA